ncbi:MAG TPA: hypothetical protein VF160_01625 [Candidatus Dormibacteraeota bacterium]
MNRQGSATRVYVEAGSKRVFACALDWPGWCRSGRTEAEALAALAAYAPRYAPVAKLARVKFDAQAAEQNVVERVCGGATTDFGAPEVRLASDSEPLKRAALKRTRALLGAAWQYFDRAAERAPERLRKGPRGGGRDTAKIVEHVYGAEGAYAPKLGVRVKDPQERREAVLAALDSEGTPWPARYLARRTAWHALDHAWEIEDRSPA